MSASLSCIRTYWRLSLAPPTDAAVVHLQLQLCNCATVHRQHPNTPILMHTTRELYHYERLVELYMYILTSLAGASNWRRCRPPKTATLQLCNANPPTHQY